MNQIDPTRLLTEMRQLAQAAQAQPATAGGTEAAPGQSFANLLKTSIASVNETQQSASELAAAFEMGKSDVSLAEVMIALQKANLSFQAMTEVRNRLVSAYQEIMNMPV
jgi:flagellar hook-basal body complex protein FliE